MSPTLLSPPAPAARGLRPLGGEVQPNEFVLTNLDDVLFADADGPQPQLSNDGQPAPFSFSIDSLEKAAWAARRTAQAMDRITDRQALAATYHQKIDTWLDQANSPDHHTIDYLTYLLRPFVEAEIAKNPRRKTLSFFGATVQLRRRPDHLDINDEASAMAFCETHHPEAVVTTKTLSKSIVRDLLKKGQEVHGAILVPGTEDLIVKAAPQ